MALQVLFESDLARHETSFVTNRALQNSDISPSFRKFAIELIKIKSMHGLEIPASYDNRRLPIPATQVPGGFRQRAA